MNAQKARLLGLWVVIIFMSGSLGLYYGVGETAYAIWHVLWLLSILIWAAKVSK